MAFVTSVFDEQMAIREEKLHMLLENRLDNQRDSITVDDIGIETLGESNEAKAKRLVKEGLIRDSLLIIKTRKER